MILRNFVLVCALLLTVVGLILLALGHGPGLQLAIGAGIFSLLILGECWRYRRARPGGGAGEFEATGERYRDPISGELMEVEFDPTTGARRYVKASEP
ncbi:MAG: hypothetical protein ACRER1_06815 [Gammaproteobacteria bacterium]